MALQQKVYTHVVPAIAGMVEAGNDAHYSAVAYKASTALPVGNFVAYDSENANCLTNVVKSKKIIGIIPRVIAYATPGLDVNMTVPAGEFTVPLVRGHIAVKTATQAKVGQNVFASETDGSVGTADALTLAGYVPTNFTVEKLLGDGSAGTLIIITNQGAQNYPAA